MVAVTILLSQYTILYGRVKSLVASVQLVARRWTAILNASLRNSLQTISVPFESPSSGQTVHRVYSNEWPQWECSAPTVES